MSSFIPTGYLTVTAAVDRVVELMQGGDLSRLLTEDERATLRNWQYWLYRIKHPQPAPVTPVPRADGRRLPVARISGKKYPQVLVEAKPERPNVTAEALRDLKEKETFFNEQRPAAEAVLRQLLYVGRVPWEFLADNPIHDTGSSRYPKADT